MSECRKAFEKWYVDNLSGKRSIAWMVWQAAWSACADKWQPIETAPKDGRTLLLGHRNALGNWRTLRGRWIPKAEIEEHWEEDDFPEGFYEEAVEADEPNCWPTEPTHWMPLPEPPA